MTLSDMAREIERRKPGTLPESVRYGLSFTVPDNDPRAMKHDTREIDVPNDIAEAVLRDAMVNALIDEGEIIEQGKDYVSIVMQMGRHLYNNGDRTAQLFAAFCATFPFPEPTK